MRFRCVYKSDRDARRPLKLVWAKHAWNLVCDLTWPLASLNLLLWGTRGSGVSRHVFIPLTCMQYCLLALGAAQHSACCSSVMTQANSRGSKPSWMDHWFDAKWQSPCCDFFQRQEIVGGQGEAESGERAGEGHSLSMASCSRIPPARLPTCEAEHYKVPGSEAQQGTRKETAGILEPDDPRLDAWVSPLLPSLDKWISLSVGWFSHLWSRGIEDSRVPIAKRNE